MRQATVSAPYDKEKPRRNPFLAPSGVKKGLPSSLVQLRTAVWTGDARDTRPIRDKLEPCYTFAMSPRAFPAPVWFVAALIPMVASQIVRLQQHDPGSWIFWDYTGRLSGLAVIAKINTSMPPFQDRRP
jgi:hypothetical protein